MIGGQHKDHLVKQLHDFRTGARDTDMPGTMNEPIRIMTDAEIEACVRLPLWTITKSNNFNARVSAKRPTPPVCIRRGRNLR